MMRMVFESEEMDQTYLKAAMECDWRYTKEPVLIRALQGEVRRLRAEMQTYGSVLGQRPDTVLGKSKPQTRMVAEDVWPSVPEAVKVPRTVSAITSGCHLVALASDGTLWAYLDDCKGVGTLSWQRLPDLPQEDA